MPIAMSEVKARLSGEGKTKTDETVCLWVCKREGENAYSLESHVCESAQNMRNGLKELVN